MVIGTLAVGQNGRVIGKGIISFWGGSGGKWYMRGGLEILEMCYSGYNALQNFPFTLFWNLPPQNHRSYPTLIRYLCLFDFTCRLTTFVHSLVPSVNQKLTQDFVHIRSTFYEEKLCHLEG